MRQLLLRLKQYLEWKAQEKRRLAILRQIQEEEQRRHEMWNQFFKRGGVW